MKKSLLLRTSLVILISCILLLFPFVACEHDSNANSNPTNNGEQPASGGTPATPPSTPSTTGNQSPNPELPEGSYSITYVLDGGSWIEGYTPTQIYTADDYISLPNAGKVHKDGYTFTGWYENNSLKFGFAKGTTGNKTYTAHWEDGEHTPVGYYNNGSEDTACGAGRYQAYIDSTSCNACPPGKFQTSEGATGCFTCPAGTSSSAGSSSCTMCQKGYYSSEGSASCIPSPTGSYVSTKGATAPTPCPAGTYQDLTGQSSCKACPAGTTSEEGSTSASACH